MNNENIQDANAVYKSTNSDYLLIVSNNQEKINQTIKKFKETEKNNKSLIIATANNNIYKNLKTKKTKIFFKSLGKISIIQHSILRAYEENTIKEGDKITCYNADEGVIILRKVDDKIDGIGFNKLMKLQEADQQVIERIIDIAIKIGRSVNKKGRTFGAFFIIGDSKNVIKKSRQLIINPYKGHERKNRNIKQKEALKSIMELIKLDGAFIITKKGHIKTAGTFVETNAKINIPSGLGSRHTSAASITKTTNSLSITVSKTDGNVRIFRKGNLILEIDPNMMADF